MIYLWKKTLKMQNIVILVKSVFNENCNHYYYEKLLENINRNNLYKCYIMKNRDI